jgi:hypothetical protein
MAKNFFSEAGRKVFLMLLFCKCYSRSILKVIQNLLFSYLKRRSAIPAYLAWTG